MIWKANKLIIQDSREDNSEEAVEGSTVLSQGDEEFDESDEKFEEARAEEKSFDAARAEESSTRACS